MEQYGTFRTAREKKILKHEKNIYMLEQSHFLQVATILKIPELTYRYVLWSENTLEYIFI